MRQCRWRTADEVKGEKPQKAGLLLCIRWADGRKASAGWLPQLHTSSERWSPRWFWVSGIIHF